MGEYLIRKLVPADHDRAVEIYNSNPRFLLRHLGCERVDAAFIEREAAQMGEIGFMPCVITDAESVWGVLDYKAGEETYLSLLLLDAAVQGRGFGREIYFRFESEMRRLGSKTVRIDVVDDGGGDPVGFWRKLGFSECERVTLEWGDRKNGAVVMRKDIGK